MAGSQWSRGRAAALGRCPAGAYLVDGLVGSGVAQLSRPVSGQDDHGYPALRCFHDSWQQIGHSSA